MPALERNGAVDTQIPMSRPPLRFQRRLIRSNPEILQQRLRLANIASRLSKEK